MIGTQNKIASRSSGFYATPSIPATASANPQQCSPGSSPPHFSAVIFSV